MYPISKSHTYLLIINTHNNHRVRRHLLNSIEVPRGINRLDRSIASTARTGTAIIPALQLVHARLAPLAHEAGLVVVLAGGGLVAGREGHVIAGGLGAVGGAVGVEPRDAEEGAAEGLLAGALEGLGVGDNALGSCVGFVDGVGDVVVCVGGAGGDHVCVGFLVGGVDCLAGAEAGGGFFVGEVRF